jgi:hypothetical protein
VLAARRRARAPRLGQPRGDRPPHDRPRPAGGPPRGPRARRSGAAVPPGRSVLLTWPSEAMRRPRSRPVTSAHGSCVESLATRRSSCPSCTACGPTHRAGAAHRRLALGEQVLKLGADTNDDGLLLQGNMEVGWSHFFLGELEQAREHLERRAGAVRPRAATAPTPSPTATTPPRRRGATSLRCYGCSAT